MPNKALCILTGASRGIGGAILEKLSHQGYSVIAISRGKTLQSTSLAVSETKNQIFHVPFDLGEVEKFNELEMVGLAAAERIKQIERDLQTSTSVLINCAGISRDSLAVSSTLSSIQSTLNVNLIAPMLLSRLVLRNMIKKKQGHIINISSIIGPVQGNQGQSIYAASKAGILGFSKSLAREVASRNIMVHTIAPGFIESDMTGQMNESARKKYLESIPMQRFGKAEEIAELVMMLLKSSSLYMTGTCLVADGGLTV